MIVPKVIPQFPYSRRPMMFESWVAPSGHVVVAPGEVLAGIYPPVILSCGVTWTGWPARQNGVVYVAVETNTSKVPVGVSAGAAATLPSDVYVGIGGAVFHTKIADVAKGIIYPTWSGFGTLHFAIPDVTLIP